MFRRDVIQTEEWTLSLFVLHQALFWVNTQLDLYIVHAVDARGSVVGWGTTLQAGRWPVRAPDEVDFFNLPDPSTRTMALGSTQPLTEMTTRNFPEGKKRPARRA
jgi:hypothetical protein